MTILYQVHDELVAAARRPRLKTRISVKVVSAVIAAVLALLIAAPPSVAGLSVSASVVITHIPQ